MPRRKVGPMRSHALVGREAALRFLRERYYKARCGDGGAVLITGDPGIGKTRLCSEFCGEVARDDENVVTTRSLDYASSPFAPIVETVEAWLVHRPHLFDVQVGLRDAVRVIASADTQGQSPTAGERRRCFDSIARLFRIASADAPTTLLVDDLHEADPATVQLLGHVLAATRRSAFMLIATTRPIDLVPSARRAELARLLRMEHVDAFPLGKLDAAAMQELIRDAASGRLDRATRNDIAIRADGNPLFAEELVRQAVAASGSPRAVPMSVAGMFVERLDRLSQRDRSLLTFAAVIGVEFSGAFLATVTETAPAAAYGSIRAACALGLVEETADPDVFRFRHGLTRDAVYAEPLEIERRAMHRQVFETMRNAPLAGPIGAVAHHAYAANDAVWAAYYGELAGDHAAANRAASTAIPFYERALETCEPSATGRLCEKLARACLAAGFLDLAEEPARRLLTERIAANDSKGVLDAYLLLAEVAGQRGADEGRLATFAAMSEYLETLTDSSYDALRGLCETELAFAESDMKRVVALSDGPGVRAAPDASVAVAIANARAHALLVQGQYRRAIASQALAVRRAIREGDRELETTTRIELGVVSILGGELGRAARSFHAAASIAGARVATTEHALGSAMAAEAELMQGNQHLARRFLAETLASAGGSDHPGILIVGGRVGIWLAMREGDHDYARRVVDTLDLERAMFGRAADRLHPLAGAFARHLMSTGRQEEAEVILRRAIARLKGSNRYRTADWSVCSMLTVAEVGHPDDIPHARGPLEDSCARFASAFVDLFDAIVASREGRVDESIRFAEAAIGPFLKYGLVFEATGALALAERKREALELAERHGFTVIARTLAEELRVTNRQGRAAAELTKRERDVARLVEAGLTNRLIADRLCVSEKTVETHLASIFSKLGIRSRLEIGDAPVR